MSANNIGSITENFKTMNNKYLFERSLKSVWHPCTQMKKHETTPLVPINRGEGVWLYDTHEKRYLNAISSWWANLFGHTNPRISEAIKDQLDNLEHVMLAGFTHEPVVSLSEQLSQITPGSLKHCFYASDGSSAIEIALKMSFHYWLLLDQPKKTDFISLQNGYHGETLGALSVTDVALFKETYAPLLRPSTQMPTPDWRYAKNGESPKEYALYAAQKLETYIAEHHHTIAALIIEPLVQGAMGMGMYHPIYLQRARELCDQYQVHLIADEIAVGFGRTGTLFACEQADITPDILCLSKGLTGGYLPLSTTITSEAIFQAFYHDKSTHAFLHSHTHAGNALACRAALATLDIFKEDNVIEKNRDKTTYLNKISKVIADHPKTRNFRYCGMIWAFEVISDDPNFTTKFFQSGLEHQLLLRPLEKTVYFMPPYIINEEEMDFLVNGTLKILNTLP